MAGVFGHEHRNGVKLVLSARLCTFRGLKARDEVRGVCKAGMKREKIERKETAQEKGEEWGCKSVQRIKKD